MSLSICLDDKQGTGWGAEPLLCSKITDNVVMPETVIIQTTICNSNDKARTYWIPLLCGRTWTWGFMGSIYNCDSSRVVFLLLVTWSQIWSWEIEFGKDGKPVNNHTETTRRLRTPTQPVQPPTWSLSTLVSLPTRAHSLTPSKVCCHKYMYRGWEPLAAHQTTKLPLARVAGVAAINIGHDPAGICGIWWWFFFFLPCSVSACHPGSLREIWSEFHETRQSLCGAVRWNNLSVMIVWIRKYLWIHKL